MALLKYRISFASSIERCKSRARTSIPSFLLTSVEVVMTGVASIKPATLFASSLAPPKCPDKVDITNCPLSSMFMTAGSVDFDSTNGATDLISIPEAIMAITAS